MLFSICHTTARPEGWQASARQWIQNAVNPVNYVLCVDRRWGFDTRHEGAHTEIASIVHRDRHTYGLVQNEGRQCSVDGWNTAARYATGDVLILNADDFFPEPEWDTKLEAAIRENRYFTEPSHNEFVVHVSTGNPDKAWEDRLITLGIMSRSLYAKWGYALYPQYESMYSDDDFTQHAYQDNLVIQARDVLIEHRHPVFHKAVEDDVYRWQNRQSSFDMGKKLLEERKARRFAW